MRACVMVEPQEGMTYDRLVHIGRLAGELGLEGLFRSDHYQGLSGPAEAVAQTDAWATLAGLARDLAGGVVGTLVSPVTFRHPGQLAKVVATVAHMSAGPRVELGLGTGWNPGEHQAFGFDFGDSFGARFAILEEYIQVVRGLLSGEAFSFSGRHYTLDNAGNRPAADVRVIVGGMGEKRTPRLAARFADELNVVMLPPDLVAQRIATCREFLEREGRDPDGFAFSWMGPFAIGRTEAEAEARAGRLVYGQRGVSGTVAEATEAYGRLKEAGVERVMLQHLITDDDDHLAMAAEAAAAA